MITQKMINYRVYDNGNDLLGMADVQLPSIEYLSESIKGAGIAGEFDAPTMGHFAPMALTINWRTIDKEQLALSGISGKKLDLRAAIQAYNASTGEYVIKALRVVVIGTPKKADLGKLVVAGTSDASTELSVSYLKVELDGVKLIEIDIFNYIGFIDGKDWLADVKKALGLI